MKFGLSYSILNKGKQKWNFGNRTTWLVKTLSGIRFWKFFKENLVLRSQYFLNIIILYETTSPHESVQGNRFFRVHVVSRIGDFLLSSQWITCMVTWFSLNLIYVKLTYFRFTVYRTSPSSNQLILVKWWSSFLPFSSCFSPCLPLNGSYRFQTDPLFFIFLLTSSLLQTVMKTWARLEFLIYTIFYNVFS